MAIRSAGRAGTRDGKRFFADKSLRHMIRFAEAYQDETIVSTLPGQLSWSHFLNLISIDEPLKRDFIRKCAGWSAQFHAPRLEFSGTDSGDEIYAAVREICLW